MDNSKLATPSYNNARTGALFANGEDMLGLIQSGEWKDGASRKHRLVLGADVDGKRMIATVSADGSTVKSRGVVTANVSNNPKAPHYRGKLGTVDIVLYHVDAAQPYYQVRVDQPRPAKAELSADVLGFLSPADETVGPEIDLSGPF